MAALLFVAAVVILAVVGGFLGADSRDGADWSPPTRTNGDRRVLQGRNCATRDLASPHDTTSDSASHLRGSAGT